jgi:hypothetical protein
MGRFIICTYPHDIIRQIKSRRMRREGQLECMGEERKVHKVLVRKPEEKKPLRRLRHRCKMGSKWISGRLAEEEYVCVCICVD